MGRFRKTFGRTLAALGLSLISGWAEADVILVGVPTGAPGREVEFAIEATAGTFLSSIDIVPAYETFAKVLTLVDIEVAPVLEEEALGFCLDGGCSYFFISQRSFGADTLLATLRFRVTDDALAYAGPGDGGYPFDLGVLADASEHIGIPTEQMFTVLAIPEPSTWNLTAVGILLLVANWCGRSPDNSRRSMRKAQRFLG